MHLMYRLLVIAAVIAVGACATRASVFVPADGVALPVPRSAAWRGQQRLHSLLTHLTAARQWLSGRR